MIPYRHNMPDWRVALEGQDLTGKLRPRLVSLSLSEKRDEEADQLDIVLEDTDGGLALPRPGALLTLSLGWKQGLDVTPGLVAKGAFKVDEIEHSGPPDQITLRARSADFTGDLRVRREHSWHDTTLGAVLSDVAGRNGLRGHIAPDLARIVVSTLCQSRESDTAFLRRLGTEHDAVATIKSGCLLFTRKGAGTTPGGKPIPMFTIRRSEGDQHRWTRETRDEHAGVTAYWHDKGEAKRQSVTVGEKHGSKRLRKIYASEAEATRAAIAERARLKRMPATLELRLALGRPDAYPEQRVKVSGFKPEIDATTWLITEVSHRLNSNGGFTTDLRMETAP